MAEAHGLDKLAQVMVDISTGEDGALYALPIGLETQNLMFYAPAAFEAAGVAPPATWEEFLAAASALESEHPGVSELLRVYGAGSEDDAVRHFSGRQSTD